MTSIDFVTEKKSYNVFVRMYFDDFRLDCKSVAPEIQNISFSENNSASGNVMEKYLNEKVIIKVDTEQLSGKLLEMKVADNEISIKMEYYPGIMPGTITVKNTIMTSLYSDMTNMLIVKVNDFEEGFKLSSDLTEHTFKIK
jgi:hypothetical protein